MYLERRGRSEVLAVALAAILSAAVTAGAQAPAQSPAPAPSPSREPGPVKGEVVAPFEAQGVDGTTYHVDYAKGTTTILLFFLSGCPHCQRMIPEWARMFEERHDSLRILGVIMDREPPGFFSANPIPFQVVRAPSPDFLRSYKIARVPVTMRVAPGGKIEDVAVGNVDGIRLGDLFRP